MTASTSIYAYSPGHEVDKFGRNIEVRQSDGERFRPRKKELETWQKYWRLSSLREQNLAFGGVVSTDENGTEEERVLEEEMEDLRAEVPKARIAKKKVEPL